MTASIVLFAIAAAGGSVLAYLRFRNKQLPMPLALVHGALAATGLVVLLLAVFSGARAPSPDRIAFGLFVLAALGGLALFSFHVRKRQLPLGLVVVHGLVAVVAFALLLVGAGALGG